MLQDYIIFMLLAKLKWSAEICQHRMTILALEGDKKLHINLYKNSC